MLDNPKGTETRRSPGQWSNNFSLQLENKTALAGEGKGCTCTAVVVVVHMHNSFETNLEGTGIRHSLEQRSKYNSKNK